MKKPLIILLLLSLAFRGTAQTFIKANVGVGYLEHFSIGPSISLKEKTTLSISYGSNLFYKPRNFSTLYFQYDRVFPILGIKRFTPGAGLKAGHTVFTDDYYRWKVISAVPFVMLTTKLNAKVDLIAETGLAISRIESVTRVSYGEIGKYKRYLPELKLSVRYRVTKL